VSPYLLASNSAAFPDPLPNPRSQDARLRTLADFENLQKRAAREKQAAKDFALQSFAKDLISEIDVLNLALRSIPEDRVTAADNADLKGLYEGVGLLKRGLEKVLGRHGIVAFDPTGEQFDPNRHEALYQAPVPGKEPGSVLECQEIGCALPLPASLFPSRRGSALTRPRLAPPPTSLVALVLLARRHDQGAPPPPRKGRRRPLAGVRRSASSRGPKGDVEVAGPCSARLSAGSELEGRGGETRRLTSGYPGALVSPAGGAQEELNDVLCIE
jgi:molecular chaperone GrpE